MEFIINIILIIGLLYAFIATYIPIQSTIKAIFDVEPSMIRNRQAAIAKIPYFVWVVAGIYILKIIAWAVLITTIPTFIVISILLYALAFSISWTNLDKDKPNVILFKVGRLAFIYDIILSIWILVV